MGVREEKNKGGGGKKFARLFGLCPSCQKKILRKKLPKIVVEGGGGGEEE